MFRIPLTTAQKEHAEWAIDPMTDVTQEEDPESRWYEDRDLPTVEDDALVFPHPSMAVDDLLYRLTEQLRDMAAQAHERYPQAAAALAAKVEHAAQAAGWTRTMSRGWVAL